MDPLNFDFYMHTVPLHRLGCCSLPTWFRVNDHGPDFHTRVQSELTLLNESTVEITGSRLSDRFKTVDKVFLSRTRNQRETWTVLDSRSAASA